MKSQRLTTIILIGMVLGILVGWACHELWPDPKTAKTVADYISLITDIFLRLIKMIIAPLVFSTLVAGIAHMEGAAAVGRVGAKPILIAGMTLLTAGLFWFTDISVNGTYLGSMLAPSLLTALGIGLAFVPATITAVAGVESHEAGLASGLVNTARLFGGALGLAILAAIAASRTNSDLHHVGTTAHAALVSGFQLAFLVAAGFALVGLLVAAFGLPRTPARAPAQPREMAVVESA